jgi:hypothetical protein
MTRDEWVGWMQRFLEDRIMDAPDKVCLALAHKLWDMIADMAADTWEDESDAKC